MASHNQPTDLSLYSNGFGFMRQPLDLARTTSADVTVLGVPFDMATTGRAGARGGPSAIRQASLNLAWEAQRWPWTFCLAEQLSIRDVGDFIYPPGDAETFTDELSTLAQTLITKNQSLLSFGGDHFITLPLLRAHKAVHGPLAMIHFDAHTDTYSQGSRYDHGTMFYHAPKEGLIEPDRSVQIGIRTEYQTQQHPFTVIDAAQANDQTTEAIVTLIKETVGRCPVYLTFDIDCLDPAFAPGTGTPVCGGLSSHKVLSIIRGLAGINLVGMDVVEVSPAYDSSEVTALAAATIGVELLHLIAINKHSNLLE